MPNHNQSRCHGCGAIIVWGRTPKGQPIPMDPTPIAMPKGAYYMIQEPGKPIQCVPVPEQVFLSHFASCPDRDKFRRKPAATHGRREVVRA